MHVPDTGHTPVLSDRNQNWFIHEWLMDRTAARASGPCCTRRLRDDPEIKSPIRLVTSKTAA